MNTKYSISAILPIYNVEKYLPQCLQSIVTQTILFDEVIMVNDGSTDNSQEICEQYCLQYPYLKLINQSNQGPSVARNEGIKYSKCDYFVFLDADDYIAPKMVEILKRRLNGQDILCYAATIQEDIKGVTHPNIYIRHQEICKGTMTGMEFFYKSFPHNYIVSPCLAAYKRAFLEEYHIQFPKGLYYEDDFFFIQVICNAKKIECLCDKLYVRRYRVGSTMTGDLDEKRYIDKIKIQLKIWDYLKCGYIDKWEKPFLLKYILYNVLKILWMKKQCKTLNERNSVIYWKKFNVYWRELCETNIMSFGDCYILMKIYNELIQIDKEKYFEIYKTIKKLFELKFLQIMKGLSLDNKDKKIGIYGMGHHTKVMFELYEKYVGKIQCSYYYIVSDISLETSSNNIHPIVSLHHIPKDTDFIIISSLVYRNEMIKNLEKIEIPSEIIYSLYDVDDVCDLTMISEIG